MTAETEYGTVAQKMRADSGQAAEKRVETLRSKERGTGSERRREKGRENMRGG